MPQSVHGTGLSADGGCGITASEARRRPGLAMIYATTPCDDLQASRLYIARSRQADDCNASGSARLGTVNKGPESLRN